MYVLMPPVALLILLMAVGGLSMLLSRLAFRPKIGAESSGMPYACGEDIPTHMIQPDYGQFFPFAFFFTILHVVALMSTTVSAQTSSAFVLACLYIVGAVVGLTVLYRK
jgi:hypothetical protein